MTKEISLKGSKFDFIPDTFAANYGTLTSERLTQAVASFNEYASTMVAGRLDNPVEYTHSIHWLYRADDYSGWNSLYTHVPKSAELRRSSVASHLHSMSKPDSDFYCVFWVTNFSNDFYSATVIDPGGMYVTLRFRLDNGHIDEIRAVNQRTPLHCTPFWHDALFAQHISSGADEHLPSALQ